MQWCCSLEIVHSFKLHGKYNVQQNMFLPISSNTRIKEFNKEFVYFLNRVVPVRNSDNIFSRRNLRYSWIQ